MLARQEDLLIGGVALQPPDRRFGFPRAVVVLMLAGRSEDSLDSLADALLALADRSAPRPPVVESLRRRDGTVAGYSTLRLEGEVRIGRQLTVAGTWLARAALRVIGVDPLRFRCDLFDRHDRRHAIGLVSGARDFARYLPDLEAIGHSSTWDAT